MAEYNIDSIVMPNGEAQEITAIVMPNGDEYTFSGGVTPTGNIDITQAGVTDVTNYATATVVQGEVYADANSGFYKENGVDKWHFQPRADVEVGDYRGTPGYIPDFYYTAGADHVFDALPSTTVTPSTAAQTIGGANYMMEGAVTVEAMPTGTEGTPTATKGAVSNHSVSITPSVTNTAGYISGGTKTGTAVSVSASELVSGTYNVTSSGTKDVTNYASASVPSGSATPAASISGTSATVSTGTNTLTLSKTVSNTPQVSAGYVSSGTAGNSSVSLTANVTTKAAATITPGTTNQTIASGTYLTGAQTISGDANLVAGNIKNGTTIFGVTGTYEGSNPVKTKTGTFTGNGTRTIDVACDFEPDLVYVTSDPGTTASSGTVAFIIARDMMAASRYRNNSTTNSHYAVTPCVNLNTSGSSYSWRATYASNKVTLYCWSSGARSLLTNGRTYTYQFVKWTT